MAASEFDKSQWEKGPFIGLVVTGGLSEKAPHVGQRLPGAQVGRLDCDAHQASVPQEGGRNQRVIVRLGHHCGKGRRRPGQVRKGRRRGSPGNPRQIAGGDPGIVEQRGEDPSKRKLLGVRQDRRRGPGKRRGPFQGAALLVLQRGRGAGFPCNLHGWLGRRRAVGSQACGETRSRCPGNVVGVPDQALRGDSQSRASPLPRFYVRPPPDLRGFACLRV